jgi:hypothetical protein
MAIMAVDSLRLPDDPPVQSTVAGSPFDGAILRTLAAGQRRHANQPRRVRKKRRDSWSGRDTAASSFDRPSRIDYDRSTSNGR